MIIDHLCVRITQTLLALVTVSPNTLQMKQQQLLQKEYVENSMVRNLGSMLP